MDKQECIERQLESALLEGRWGVFERLPSERGLAEAFGVNRATVRAALRALAGRGILETRRGSGTVVRALPGDARHAAGTFADYLAAFRILMPPLVAASLPAVSPSVILELERLLPSAGASLRNGDMKTFIQAQIRFFSILIRVLGNPRLEDAASRVLPDGLALARLLQECTLPQCENVFAQLARLLSALRHADHVLSGPGALSGLLHKLLLGGLTDGAELRSGLTLVNITTDRTNKLLHANKSSSCILFCIHFWHLP